MSEAAVLQSGQRIRIVDDDPPPAMRAVPAPARTDPGDTPPSDKGPAPSEREAPAAAAPSRRRWSARRLGLAGAALVVGLGAASYAHHWWTVGRFFESTDDAYVGGEITVVAPKVAGFIAEVVVTDNQAVRAGDLLVKLDDRDYRAALAKAKAAVARQQASLVNLDATRRLQLAVIAQARAVIDATDAEIVWTRDDQARYRQLAATAAASVQLAQKADSAYKQAMAAGEKARASLEAAQHQLDVIDAQKQQARAALAGARAERDIARLNLSYTELRAPVDGTVGNRSARRGAFASVGAQLLSIVPAQGLWVDANYKENQLAHIRPGQPVTIEADVLPGQVFHGRVVSLAPATGARFSVLPPENATGNFTKIVQRVPVRIELEGDAAVLGRLRPGLSVTADVDGRIATDGKS
ncbi:HlyD family secretion protein [Vineibacter terrae]|uniref:HlyD family secretion protein n=1 Tax=Vineibacter terrae TaxID=2586908 RepID=UPI002E2F519D|nr:HlyD family secretion protein [Vineibacter terrae]HEX2885731.1 HlyD family secretion protein [Vineibacter terrae]